MIFEGKLLCESKYGEPRYYDEQADGTYLVYGPSHFVRTVKGQFDFEGGPYLSAGDPFIIEKKKIGIIEDTYSAGRAFVRCSKLGSCDSCNCEHLIFKYLKQVQ